MTQNTSHAVMAQRREPAHSLDFFPTPPWATRALCEWLGKLDALHRRSCWDPACGAGDMARPLAEYFREVHASDIHDYDYGFRCDFLLTGGPPKRTDWIITNPPFRLAEQFASTARPLASHGVALLVRTAFLESASRYESLFSTAPPTDILQFVERVPMFKGHLNRSGSTATAYCWLVWDLHNRDRDTRFHWLAPCRKRLERDSDYEPVAPLFAGAAE